MDASLSLLWQYVFSPANIVGLIAFVLVFCLLQQYAWHQTYANIPPGPKPWPIVGNFGAWNRTEYNSLEQDRIE
uniref:Uncharacterized protein n=1 Tax=Sinocyclocheilus anshuiensis TaxID=1608454 RepID=A0A671RZV3_9TELE